MHTPYFKYTMSTTSLSADSQEVGRVLVERHGGLLILTLDRPEHGNELTRGMLQTILDVLAEEAATPRASALLLRATGDVFCTGRERVASDLADLRVEAARLINVKRALRRASLVTIARVQGAAKGFGMGLAILCDFAIVARHAELCFPEMRAGLPPAAIMAYLGEYALPRHVFPLVLFGEPFTPEHARAIGLISDVVDAHGLDAAVDATVARVLALPPDSARACKELFSTMSQGAFDENCRLATDALTLASATLLRKGAH